MDTRKKEKIKNDTPAEERKSNRERRETQQEGKIPFPGSSCTRTPESEFITKTRKKKMLSFTRPYLLPIGINKNNVLCFLFSLTLKYAQILLMPVEQQ
jgi:hypothetical protein